MDKPSNVVFLDRALSRSREAEMLLIDRVRLLRSRRDDDESYALQVMDLKLRELAWAKKWGLLDAVQGGINE
ncbi:hypothetical protein [Neptunomonas phycophila]|uniref:hypothetical protein n=1 Tax=Neptunomonas phycophila TaxID=1572645 RepID=UPI00373537E9